MREVAFKVPEASRGRGGKRHTLIPSPGPLLQDQDRRLAGVFTSPHLGSEHLLSGEAPRASAHSRDGPACTPCPAGFRRLQGTLCALSRLQLVHCSRLGFKNVSPTGPGAVTCHSAITKEWKALLWNWQDPSRKEAPRLHRISMAMLILKPT